MNSTGGMDPTQMMQAFFRMMADAQSQNTTNGAGAVTTQRNAGAPQPVSVTPIDITDSDDDNDDGQVHVDSTPDSAAAPLSGGSSRFSIPSGTAYQSGMLGRVRKDDQIQPARGQLSVAQRATNLPSSPRRSQKVGSRSNLSNNPSKITTNSKTLSPGALSQPPMVTLASRQSSVLKEVKLGKDRRVFLLPGENFFKADLETIPIREIRDFLDDMSYSEWPIIYQHYNPRQVRDALGAVFQDLGLITGQKYQWVRLTDTCVKFRIVGDVDTASTAMIEKWFLGSKEAYIMAFPLESDIKLWNKFLKTRKERHAKDMDEDGGDGGWEDEDEDEQDKKPVVSVLESKTNKSKIDPKLFYADLAAAKAAIEEGSPSAQPQGKGKGKVTAKSSSQPDVSPMSSNGADSSIEHIPSPSVACVQPKSKPKSTGNKRSVSGTAVPAPTTPKKAKGKRTRVKVEISPRAPRNVERSTRTAQRALEDFHLASSPQRASANFSIGKDQDESDDGSNPHGDFDQGKNVEDIADEIIAPFTDYSEDGEMVARVIHIPDGPSRRSTRHSSTSQS